MSKYFCPTCETTSDYLVSDARDPTDVRCACPECRGQVVNAIRCDVCFEYITGDYIRTTDGQHICDECYLIYNIQGEELYC